MVHHVAAQLEWRQKSAARLLRMVRFHHWENIIGRSSSVDRCIELMIPIRRRFWFAVKTENIQGFEFQEWNYQWDSAHSCKKYVINPGDEIIMGGAAHARRDKRRRGENNDAMRSMDKKPETRHDHLWLVSLHFTSDDDTTDNWHGNESHPGALLSIPQLPLLCGFMWFPFRQWAARGSRWRW